MDPVFAPVRGFNASYKRIFLLCGSLRLPTYLGQTVSCSHSEHFMPAKRALHGSRKASASCLRKTGRRGRRPLPCAYGALHFFVLTGVSLGTCFVSRV